jgi:hypothetical protein|tara:strand:+ start:4730 stop:5242 length:513 start_codon:yes stop_codon:yes gene_type:complete
MSGVVKGVYYCNQNRTQELSDRMYNRNVSNAPVKMQYDIRPVQTRYVQMPILDCHKEATVPCLKVPIYNTEQMFMPGNSLPFNGFQANIDVETRLHNTVFPIQACPQSKYVASSNSDMYNNSYLTTSNNPIPMTNELLFKEERFNQFDPNTCNTGHKLFSNHTRIQIRNL